MFCHTCRGVVNTESAENVAVEFTAEQQADPSQYPANFMQIGDWVIADPSDAELADIDWQCPECDDRCSIDSMVVNSITPLAESAHQGAQDQAVFDALAHDFAHLAIHMNDNDAVITRAPSEADQLVACDNDISASEGSDTASASHAATCGDSRMADIDSLHGFEFVTPTSSVKRSVVTSCTDTPVKRRRRFKGPQ